MEEIKNYAKENGFSIDEQNDGFTAWTPCERFGLAVDTDTDTATLLDSDGCPIDHVPNSSYSGRDMSASDAIWAIERCTDA